MYIYLETILHLITNHKQLLQRDAKSLS